jgi:copper chaperone NosL
MERPVPAPLGRDPQPSGGWSIKRTLTGKLRGLDRWLILGAAALMLLALIVPIWRVYLWAPQYPEGLRILIHANGVTGRLSEVNTLNHYIGMKPLSTESFAEFGWMPTALMALAGVIGAIGLIGRRELILPGWMVLGAFDLYMLWDLYHWMWDWGHDLDPKAAITMAPFTPPAVGFKHIANFYVYSLPTWGGVGVIAASLIGAIVLWRGLRRA